MDFRASVLSALLFVTITGSTITTTQSIQFMISITEASQSGDNIAGEIYSLECSVSVNRSIARPTITWIHRDAYYNNSVEINSTTTSNRTILETSASGSNYSSTLTFNPLAASDAGIYYCRATLDTAMGTASRTIIVHSKEHDHELVKLPFQ